MASTCQKSHTHAKSREVGGRERRNRRQRRVEGREERAEGERERSRARETVNAMQTGSRLVSLDKNLHCTVHTHMHPHTHTGFVFCALTIMGILAGHVPNANCFLNN